jgi:hypothetical protein
VPDSDPLVALSALPGVADAVIEARDAVDGLLWDRALRPRMAELVKESRLRGGWASAALEGADLRPEAVRDGSALDGSPMGRVLAAALRVQQETPRLVAVAERAPMQAWARLHALAGYDFCPQDELGRPRRGAEVDDPLRLGPSPAAPEAVRRADELARLMVRPSAAPALVLAAVAHGELLATRPFGWGNGLLARATTRLVLAGRGVDPDGVSMPEAGLLELGRPAYVAAIRGYLAGTEDGVAAWLAFCARSVLLGAEATRRAFAELPAP